MSKINLRDDLIECNGSALSQFEEEEIVLRSSAKRRRIEFQQIANRRPYILEYYTAHKGKVQWEIIDVYETLKMAMEAASEFQDGRIILLSVQIDGEYHTMSAIRTKNRLLDSIAKQNKRKVRGSSTPSIKPSDFSQLKIVKPNDAGKDSNTVH